MLSETRVVPRLRAFGRRDRLVVALSNLVLRLASRRYRLTLAGLVIKGMQAVDRERAELTKETG